MTETVSGAFYCVRCQDTRDADDEVVSDGSGVRMATMVCPVCGTRLSRILGAG